MALVTEDGTQKSDAEAYITVAELDEYASKRGFTLSAQSDPGKEELIRRATQFIEGRRNRWQGQKATDTQALEWPRAWVEVSGYAVQSNEIPQELKDAQCELVILLDAGTDIQPSINTSGRKRGVSVGPVRVDYAESSQPRQPVFPVVEDLLRPLEKAGGLSLTRR